MRHAWTLIAAAVMAPLAWLLLAYGQDRSVSALLDGPAVGSGLAASGLVRPALCLAAAGMLLGLLVSVRVSPLGATVTGMAYSASYLVLLLSPDRVVAVIPDRLLLAGRSFDPMMPLRTGTALMIGALLLLGVFSMKRWRRWPAHAEVGADQAGRLAGPRTVGGDDPAADGRLQPEWDRPLGADGLGLLPATSRDSRDAAASRPPDRSLRVPPPRQGTEYDHDRYDGNEYDGYGYDRTGYNRGPYGPDAESVRHARWSADG